MTFNVLSLFDGISAGQVALKRAGIQVDNYFSSEIDKYTIQVTQKHFPNTIQLGDVKAVKSDNLPKIDLMLGGFPCQSYSFSGKQKGFEDPRGQLFFEVVRLLQEVKPKYFLFENVVMKKELSGKISKLLGVEPIMINSSALSAQNRKRLYWTNIPNVRQPLNKEITWGDVREYGVNQVNMYYTPKAMQWLGRSTIKRGKMLTLHREGDKMQMIEASHHKKYSNQRFFGIVDTPSDNNILLEDVVHASKDLPLQFKFDGDKLMVVTSLGEAIPFANIKSKNPLYIRYITPLECERLQTLEDNWTAGFSDTQRYKMVGNSWTVDVISWILQNIPN